ncbi:hypothetical protein BU23DRAFT_596935 [Bimuria novae-zelandiae CBS 107.79]|uniref:Uncharacterized protein n=1 Tax=Bimuria novae-zelandiae CBS 107.79 TaxID=1447943 RepID=A0A6A5VH59_9PLEO|nr:hypothetical protein BU23DRAFT_596935 [Bimuria novae-zelandiae CBS 107.79]
MHLTTFSPLLALTTTTLALPAFDTPATLLSRFSNSDECQVPQTPTTCAGAAQKDVIVRYGKNTTQAQKDLFVEAARAAGGTVHGVMDGFGFTAFVPEGVLKLIEAHGKACDVIVYDVLSVWFEFFGLRVHDGLTVDRRKALNKNESRRLQPTPYPDVISAPSKSSNSAPHRSQHLRSHLIPTRPHHNSLIMIPLLPPARNGSQSRACGSTALNGKSSSLNSVQSEDFEVDDEAFDCETVLDLLVF